MVQLTNKERRRPLKQILASELNELLMNAAVGAEFVISSSAPICYTLELFIPELLRRRHVEWTHESLDGFFIASSKKTGPAAAELIGTCILISDQSVTPFRASFVVSTDGISLAAHRVRLGEPGVGSLGISGPPCNSKDARRLLENLTARIDRVQWVYDVHSLQVQPDAKSG